MEKLSRGVWTGLILMLLWVWLIPVVQAESLEIGIMQIIEHPSLDAARQGFINVLAENGYLSNQNVKFTYQNAQGDMSTANTIAQQFSWERPDLILAIATPTAQAAANLIKDIPILITAVTDPVGAGLVESMEKPGTNVTGTTDMTPDLVQKQLALVRKFKPEAQKVGTVYNAGEANSLVQVEAARKACQDLGLTLLEATADNTSAVLQAAQSLVGKVDALYIFTDNTVVSAIESVVMVAEENDLPLIVGEEDSVKRGGLATIGIDYYQLGRQTGEMALRIIEEGLEPATMPIERQEELQLVINKAAAEEMGVEISAELAEAAIVLE